MTLPSDNDLCELFTEIMRDTVAINKMIEAETIDKDAIKNELKKLNASAGLGKSVMSYKAVMG